MSDTFRSSRVATAPTTRSTDPALRRSSLAMLLAVAVVGVMGLAWPGPAESTESSDWKLAKQQDGIEVYTRPVAGSDVKAFRGEGVVDATVDDLLAILRDGDRFFEWFPNCPESKLLKREGSVTYQYTVMAAPWPVAERDNVFRSVLERDEESGTVEIAITAAPDFHPPQGDRVRVQIAKGIWRLEPESRDRTRIVFQMHLDPGGGVPAWMANTRVVSTPYEAIANLRKRVRN